MRQITCTAAFGEEQCAILQLAQQCGSLETEMLSIQLLTKNVRKLV